MVRAAIIGVSCFFIGLLLAVLSPLISILSLIPIPKKKPTIPLSDRLGKSWKKLEEKLKEAQDPDYGESWKQQHLDLYGDKDNGPANSET